jgi:oxygen-independent coproporphyrinogen-3 oxidase
MILSLPLSPTRVEPSLEDEPYVAYAYSYPHKSAYGPLDPPAPLAPLWQAEPRNALFLYLHIPFCEMRCGFCNLFTRAGGDEAYVEAYLDAVERQARVLDDATAGNRRFARLAIGGGTPTFLTAGQLRRLFDVAERYFNASSIPTSVETSPKTALPGQLAVLKERGVERVSVGIQSFFDDENHAIGRPQSAREVHTALERLRAFPVLNIDLIYGQPGQTVQRLLASVQAALRYHPEELYLYPLYVRPQTGIGRRGNVQRVPSLQMRQMYRAARESLLAAGYQQVSMRLFQSRRDRQSVGPIYCCQTDAMLGLGCGARSYTCNLHYSSRFAVESAGVQAILDEWIRQPETEFTLARWGCRLAEDDRQRRFVIQSLLTLPGLVAAEYTRAFGTAPDRVFSQLNRLIEHGFVEFVAGTYRLTPTGLEFSDAIGPALYSAVHRARLEGFAQS